MYTRNILTALLILSFGSITSLSAQADCMQKVDELNAEPFRTDTVRIIDAETYEETVKMVEVYLPGAPEKYEKVVEKDNMKIYYVKGDNCLMIRHIEKIAARSEEE